MSSLTIELPQDILEALDIAARKKFEEAVTKNALGGISKLDWIQNHPDGKQFMAECHRMKYGHLSGKELQSLTDARYRASLGVAERKKLTEKQARNDIITQILHESLLPSVREETNVIKFKHQKIIKA